MLSFNLYKVFKVPYFCLDFLFAGFLFHGTNDTVVPILSSMIFAENLMRAIGRENVRYRWVEGARHTKDDFDNEENYQLIGDFLDTYLKER